MRQKKDTGIGLLRVILCYFVILIHVRDSTYFEAHKTINAISNPIWFLCNSCFLMISGYYALSSAKIFEVGGVQRYYKRKLVTVILPLAFYSVFYIIDERITSGETVFSIQTVTDYLTRLVSNKISFHLWFMYALIGNFLAVPILAYAFKNMPQKNLNIIFAIATLIMQRQIVLSDFSIGTSVSFALTGWLYIFCLGWYSENTFTGRKEKWIYIAGGIGYIITIVCIRFLPVYKNSTDWALPHVLFCLSIFTLFKRRIQITNIIFDRIIEFVARYTFPIYMIHILVIKRFPPNILPVTIEQPILKHVVGGLRTYLIALFVVVIIDYIICRPIKYLAGRIATTVSKQNKYV